ncbi:hypothetical protein [Sphingomonas faeni]|uniref:hypothetical protein n=1 Tax=Sphingomonas faeni TaxID=185950 RepID=UPI00334DF2DB
MRHAVCAFALAILGSTSAQGQARIGERCSGTETIRVGDAAPQIVPYALTFSADLATGYYCYAACRAEQTYAISDRASDPIRLADIHGGNQTRLMTFDRRTATLVDHQVIRLLGSTTRSATATCRAAPFHAPVPLPGGRPPDARG